MQCDLWIRGATVIDGSGGPARTADVAVSGDAIVAVGELGSARAARTIDATGLVLTPGFIDMHSHYDQTILLYPSAPSAVAQGITTSVAGNCGFSPAPLGSFWTSGFWEWNWWDQVAPAKYYAEVVAPLAAVRETALAENGLDINWRSFGEFLARVEAARPGVNLVPLVGHSALRTLAMGSDYRRPATAEEVAVMADYCRQAMDEGAFGVSNGLDYAPNAYAAHAESVAVVQAAAARGGFFASHWRRTGLRRGFGAPALARGLQEAVDIARAAGARLQVSHLSPGYQVVPEPTPRLRQVAAEETLALLDRARSEGVQVAFDVIPNTSGGIASLRYLCGMLAPWLREAGTPEQFGRNLRWPELRNEIREYLESGRHYPLNPVTNPAWASGLRIVASGRSEWEGKTLAEVAAGAGTDAIEALFNVVSAEPRTRAVLAGGSDEALRIFLRDPRAMVGIDTFVLDFAFEVTAPPYPLPHPNTYGGMARFLSRYGRDYLGLEEAVCRLTGLPARTLGLRDRGLVAEGYRADLVVLDPAAVGESGDALEPRRQPTGFHWVLVNGVVALEAGRLTGACGGRVLRP